MTTSTAKPIENTINQAFDDILERHPDITDKHSKTAGIGLYISDRKFLQISENTRDRIEFLILRDPDKDYFRPQHGDLDIRNIRKYDPTQASYIRPWGYMFYRVLVTTEQYLDNKNVFDQIIDKSYDIANEEKILKVSKTEHKQLGPIFEGTYTFEGNDEVETSREETLDTDVEHSDPDREKREEVETEKNDEPSSDEILSEDEAEEVESKEVPSVDEKEVVADETDPDRRVFNYINKDPEKTISILDKIEISLFLELVKKDDIAGLESLYSLLSKYEIPEEYVEAFIDNKLYENSFEELIINAIEKWSYGYSMWPQFDFVMDCYMEYDQDIVTTVTELNSIDFGHNISSDWGIKPQRLIELLKSPITPVLDMTMEEAEIIYGYPSSDKEDVMKTKTVVTWTYIKPSNNIDRDVQALELKFRDGKLERYIDKRDNTSWNHDLDSFFHSLYKEASNSTKEVLAFYYAFHSLYDGEVSNNYQECETQYIEKIVKSTITNINKAKSKIVKKRGSAVKEIESGERLLEAPCKVKWNDDLFPLTKFSSGKEMLHTKINEISSREDVAEALASLNTTIKKAKKTGCFIATATMGDMNHPTVLHLRKFRDLVLLKRSWGASFIRYYYHYGPYPARIIAKSRILKFASYLIIIKPLTIITKWLLQSKNN